jgi:hypothetical protein
LFIYFCIDIIFLISFSLAFSFTENRDRCNMRLYLKPSLLELSLSTTTGSTNSNGPNAPGALVESVRYTALKNSAENHKGAPSVVVSPLDGHGNLMDMVKEHFPQWQAPNASWCTQTHGDWKVRMRLWLDPEEEWAQQALLHAFIVISPPGAGKTVFIEKVIQARLKQEMQDKQGSYEYFDASSSRLVRESLVGLLERQCPPQAKCLALVVDEYHMLSAVQKSQLFVFLLERSKKQIVKCIMIGNRAEKYDEDLVNDWRAQASLGQSVHIDFVMARLPIVHVRALCVQQNVPTLGQELVHWWLGAARSLFSDDVMTFRMLTDVLEAMSKPVKETALRDILHRKCPQLGSLTCERVSFFTLQLHSRFGARLQLDPTLSLSARKSQLRATLPELADEGDTDPWPGRA